MEICGSCGEGCVIVDPDSGSRVCNSCGVEHSIDVFRSQAFTADGRPEGSLVRSVGDFGYRERKIYHAESLISDLTSKLGLSAPRATDVTRMISDLTSGDFGGGDWFSVLVGACAYIVMRRNRIPLSIAEVSATIGREVHEIGRMVSRVSEQLNLDPLPEFDAVHSLERTIRTCPSLDGVENAKAEEMIRQGSFLMQCAVKWFLTTGRQPLPMVAAIVTFVAEVNKVEIGVEEIARDIHAGATTSKRRRKELVETLVGVARELLPWGEDVTAKNLVHHAPLLIRYMEMKSKSKTNAGGDSRAFGFDLQEILNGYSCYKEDDSRYFEVGDGDDDPGMSREELEGLKLSGESLSLAYKKVLEMSAIVMGMGEFVKDHSKKRKRGGFDFEAWKDSQVGRLDSRKRLTLEQVLRRDVGFDALPPSFVNGLESRRRRRERIEAAKQRINEVMMPSSAAFSGEKVEKCPVKALLSRKQRRRGVVGDSIDWEDCIIELLLLHQVPEEEIEQGQYNRLLDLHVFNSSSTQR